MSSKIADYANSPEIEGVVVCDKTWYLLEVPKDFHEQLLKQIQEPIKPNKKPHISIAKNEAPSAHVGEWGTKFVGDKITFKFDPRLWSENGYHVWINCYSEGLCRLREYFELTTLKTTNGEYLVNFHLTIGRLVKPRPQMLRPQWRLSPHSHIDVETMMQHL